MAVRSAADGRSVGVHVQKTSPSLLDFLLLEEHTCIYPRIEFDELEPAGGRYATRHRTLRLSLASSNRSALGSLVRHHGSCCTHPPSDFARVNPSLLPAAQNAFPFRGRRRGISCGDPRALFLIRSDRPAQRVKVARPRLRHEPNHHGAPLLRHPDTHARRCRVDDRGRPPPPTLPVSPGPRGAESRRKPRAACPPPASRWRSSACRPPSVPRSLSPSGDASSAIVCRRCSRLTYRSLPDGPHGSCRWS